jgi:hypothetical protein
VNWHLPSAQFHVGFGAAAARLGPIISASCGNRNLEGGRRVADPHKLRASANKKWADHRGFAEEIIFRRTLAGRGRTHSGSAFQIVDYVQNR